MRYLPSDDAKPIWKLLDAAPLLVMVFLNGSLYVRYCVQNDESQFSKHFLATPRVRGLMTQSKEIRNNFSNTRKGRLQ